MLEIAQILNRAESMPATPISTTTASVPRVTQSTLPLSQITPTHNHPLIEPVHTPLPRMLLEFENIKKLFPSPLKKLNEKTSLNPSSLKKLDQTPPAPNKIKIKKEQLP